jgi:hypothetical protein
MAVPLIAVSERAARTLDVGKPDLGADGRIFTTILKHATTRENIGDRFLLTRAFLLCDALYHPPSGSMIDTYIDDQSAAPAAIIPQDRSVNATSS